MTYRHSPNSTISWSPTYLLTLPVLSATCEHAHNKVDLVKTAVHLSMTSDRLQDLVLLSAEKTALDAVDINLVIDRFACSSLVWTAIVIRVFSKPFVSVYV